jgi:hypothetical protein
MRKWPEPLRDRAAFLWAVLFFGLIQAGGYLLLKNLPHLDRFTHSGQGVLTAPAIEESIIQWQSDFLLTSAEPQDVVFVGDSSCLMGVMPAIIEKNTHLKVRNLGTLAWLSAEGHADVLRLFVQHHGPPKLFVYYACPYTFAVSRKEIDKIGYLSRFRAYVSRNDWAMRLDQPRSWFPSYHLASRLLGMMQAGDPHHYLEIARGPFLSDLETAKFMRQSKGYLIEPRGPCSRPEHNQPFHSSLSDDCASGLLQMFYLAEKHHFNMMVLMSPLPDYTKTPETGRSIGELEKGLRRLAHSHPRVTIASPLLRYYPVAQFGTPWHLTPEGAARNSEEIGKWLGLATKDLTFSARN